MYTRIGALVIALIATGGVATAGATPMTSTRPCVKTYTLAMFQKATRTAYRGTRDRPPGTVSHLSRYARCQRPPSTRARAMRVWRRAERSWARRRALKVAAAMATAVASWYDDAGSTASGFHARYGVANKYLAFGTHVEFCYPPHSGRCVDATVDDRGPYIEGRDWDFDQATAGALGFSGVALVGYRIQ